MNPDEQQAHKSHSRPGNNKKSKEQKLKNVRQSGSRSAKATAVNNVRNERFKLQRAAQFQFTTTRVPRLELNARIPPPDVVAVIGPRGSGKTTVVRQLIKYYTGANVDPIGPVTISAAKEKRITFFDVPAEIAAVLDAARVADLVIICINAANGIETEIFEFLNILQAIGFPKVFTCVTHQDSFPRAGAKLKNNKVLRERIYKEIYQGSKIFFLDWNGQQYRSEQLATMGRCIAQQNYGIPLAWRSEHGCVLVDRVEKHVNGTITGFGFVQGTFINTHQTFHIPGYADVSPYNFEVMDDPAVPNQKLLLQKDKPVVYGPMSAINDVRIDDQGVHVKINLKQTPGKLGKAEAAVLSDLKRPEKTSSAGLQLFEDKDELIQVGNEPSEQSFAEESVADKEASSDDENHMENLAEPVEQAFNVDNAQDEPQNDEASFESTASKLDMEEIEEESFEAEEQVQEQDIPAPREDNEEQRVSAHLRRLRLVKPQASQQYYNDLIYNYYKQEVQAKPTSKSEQAKQKVLNLFGEDEEQKATNVTLFPKDFKFEYKFADTEFATCTVPQDFTVEVKQGRSAVVALPLSNYVQNAFITSDVDFATALDRCLNTQATTEDVQPAPEEKKNEYAVDGRFHAEMQRQVEMAKRRESLLNPQLQLHETRFAPGSYVKFTFDAIPEFASNFDPHFPLVLGALLPGELQQKFVTARVKRHRWYPKILKSRNPLIFAIGWRRFQSLPTYAAEDESDVRNVNSKAATEQMRLRMLKYTPEYTHCDCVFYGYAAPSGAGIIAFQSMDEQGWRVAATGVVTDASDGHSVYKKLKLVGYPKVIQGRTAFIERMFTTRTEANAFVGCEVKTVSGNRGLLKKSQEAGVARAQFEEKPKMSDIVILKTWVKVRIDRVVIDYDNFVAQFQGIRTVAEIRRAAKLPISYNQNSEYRKEEKDVFIKPELIVNQKTLKQLPFEQQKALFEKHEQQRLKIKDGFMKTLVKGRREFDRDQIVELAAKIQQKNQAARQEKQRTQDENQAKWKKGMEKQRDAAREQRRAEERRRKRAILGKKQESIMKRGKI